MTSDASPATKPQRILLVEDSATDAKLIVRALEGGFGSVQTERVETATQMQGALATGTWEAIISDWTMPEFSGLEALQLMKSLAIDLPFIVVSGTIGEEAAVAAMRAGACDFVLKDDLARLAPALERELREAKRRAAQRRLEESFRVQESRFRALIEKSHDGIVLISRDGKTRYMSPAAKRIVAASDLVDTGALAFIHPDDRARVVDLSAKIAAEPNTTATIEFRVLLPDGSTRWLEVVGTNLLHEPEIEAVVGNFHDVTARKLAEALATEQRAIKLERLADLERFQKLTVGRELKMIELKKEVALLKQRLPADPPIAGDPS